MRKKRLIDADRLKEVFRRNVVGAKAYDDLFNAAPTEKCVPVEVLQEIRQEIEKKQTYKLFLGSPDLYIDRDSTLEILDEYIKEYTA